MILPEFNVRTVKITRLVICILSNIRESEREIQDIISRIIRNIIVLSDELSLKGGLFSALKGKQQAPFENDN